MTTSLAEELRARHAWLFDAGFRCVEERSEASFGDACVVFEGDGVRVRVVRDRGQSWADIASSRAPTAWMAFDDVCAALFGATPPVPLTLDAAMKQLRERLPAVAPRVRDEGPALQATLRDVAARRRRVEPR